MRSTVSRLLTRFHTAPGRPRLEAGTQVSWRRALPMALLGLAFAALIVGNRVGLPDELDPTAPFVVGNAWGLHQELADRGVPVEDPDRLSQYGYDGQWFLGQANDPLLLTDLPLTFDAPRYRSVRLLTPLAGWLLAAGQGPATPYALLLVEILAVGLGCAATARVVSAYRRSPWWGVTFALIPGVWVGVAYGTAEPLGVAMAVLGVSLALQRRYLWAGLAFAGAALTKETYLAFGIGAAVFLAIDWYARGRPSPAAGSPALAVSPALAGTSAPGRPSGRERWPWLRPAAAMVVPGVAILVAWWAYVEVTLPPDDNPHGVFSRFSPPYVGWVELLATMVRGEYGVDYPVSWASEAILVATLAGLTAALALALWLRQSMLAYLAIGWALFGLIIAGFLLERFLSAQRALAPAVLAAGLFLITVQLTNRRAARERQGGHGGQTGDQGGHGGQTGQTGGHTGESGAAAGDGTHSLRGSADA